MKTSHIKTIILISYIYITIFTPCVLLFLYKSYKLKTKLTNQNKNYLKNTYDINTTNTLTVKNRAILFYIFTFIILAALVHYNNDNLIVYKHVIIAVASTIIFGIITMTSMNVKAEKCYNKYLLLL